MFLGCLGHVLLTGALLDRAVTGQVMHNAVVNFRVKSRGRGRHVLRGKTQVKTLAGEPGPTTEPGLLTWAAPSSLVAAALVWSWGHWSTSISSTSRSTSRSWSPAAASFVCRDQSRAQFPIPPMPTGHGLKGTGVGVGV